MSLYEDIKNKETNWFIKILVIIFLSKDIIEEEVVLSRKRHLKLSNPDLYYVYRNAEIESKLASLEIMNRFQRENNLPLYKLEYKEYEINIVRD